VSLTVADGVAGIDGCRSGWVVATRRAAAQNREERQRVQRGDKLPIGDNGVIVTLSGVQPDSQIVFDAKPGKHTFKLSEIPFGKLAANTDSALVPPRYWTLVPNNA